MKLSELLQVTGECEYHIREKVDGIDRPLYTRYHSSSAPADLLHKEVDRLEAVPSYATSINTAAFIIYLKPE